MKATPSTLRARSRRGRRRLTALALVAASANLVWSCGLVDDITGQGDDEAAPEDQGDAPPLRDIAPLAALPLGDGSGGSMMATGLGGVGGAAGSAISAAGAGGNAEGLDEPPVVDSTPDPVPPGGSLRQPVPAGVGCEDTDCRIAGGRCDGDTCVIECFEDDVLCNEVEVDCPDGSNCRVNCLDEDTCLETINCPNGANCEVNCDEPGTCDALIDCRGSINCEVNCRADDSCGGDFEIDGRNGATFARCDGDGSCTGDRIQCGTTACEVECFGEDSCDTDMVLDATQARLTCLGDGACTGLVDCSLNQQNCEIACAGVDSCQQGISCGVRGIPALCSVRCQGDGACDSLVTCTADRCEIDCNDASCQDDVVCEQDSSECEISCGDDACAGDVLCSADDDCIIECSGDDACGGAIVSCESQDADCSVVCRGDGACEEVECIADNGVCDVDCSGDDSCRNGVDCEADRARGDCFLNFD